VETAKKQQVIAGRYVLESMIGEGGMASVWRALDLTLERPVAVKLLFARDEREQERVIQQFLREARIAASVHHRNVINIVDFGTTDDNQPFMVMELLEGESLGQRLYREPRMTMAEVIHVMSLTLRGLAAVHEAGIIHRDLKPDNIFLTHDVAGGLFPKILDFGISRSVEPQSGRRSALTTSEGVIVGTPEYMSPEQARGVQAIDRRADIYCMGAILYEALTGELPFSSENVGDLIIQIVTTNAPLVHQRNPAISRAISDVVARAMARAPDDRFADAAEMQEALLTAAEGSVALHPRRSDLPAAIAPIRSGISPRIESPRMPTFEFSLTDDMPSDERLPLPPALPNMDDLLPAQRPLARFGLPVAAIAVALVGVLSWSLTRPDAAQPGVAEAKAVGVGLHAPSSPASPPPDTTSIKVSLRNVPVGSSITVDGEAVEGDEIELPRDGRNRVLRVTATGKAPWQTVHHATSDASYEVWLVDGENGSPTAPQLAAPQADRATVNAARKPRKKPPSALRRLDF